MTIDAGDVRALTFDVFGTVVDWRGSVARARAGACQDEQGGGEEAGHATR